MSVVLIVYRNIVTSTNLNLFIQNDSEISLKDLSIYCNDTKICTIYAIESEKQVDFKFNFPKEFSEGKIILKYNDNNSQKEMVICGYIENNSHKNFKLIYTKNNTFDIQ